MWRFAKYFKLTILTLFLISGFKPLEHNGIYFLPSSQENLSVIGIKKAKEGVVSIPGEIVHRGKKVSVSRISSSAFSERTDIQSVCISDSISYIGNESFHDCIHLSEVTLPSSLTQLSHGLFQGCINLKNILIPEKVTDIYSSAFSGCTSLSKIELPPSVSYIEDLAFSDCPNLIDVYVSWNVPSEVTCGYLPFGKDDYKKTLHVPSGMIDKYVQSGYPWNSFGHITDGTDTITSSFKSDNFIYSIECMDSSYVAVRYIGNDSFVLIPSRIRDKSGNSYIVTKIAEYAFCNMEQIKQVSLPATLKSISNFSFQNCRNLQKIDFPDSLTLIGDFAFRDCQSLHINSLPGNLGSIGNGAFVGCTSIQSIKIPESATNLGKHVFLDTQEITVLWEKPDSGLITNLLSSTSTAGILHVPAESVNNYILSNQEISTYYGVGLITDNNGEYFERAFLHDNCLYKTSSGNIVELLKCYDPSQDTITITSSIESDATHDHYKVTQIHEVAFAQNGCKVVHIEDGISVIGNDAFHDCRKLKVITFPKSVSTIGALAFYGCRRLKHVFIDSSTPPEILQGTFPPQKRIVIHVPNGSEDKYKQTPPWNNKRYRITH